MTLVSTVREVPNANLTLVLMHGLGSDEKDMAGLAEMLDPRVEVICLRAPHAYGPGYAWFDIQWTLEGIQIDEAQYWESVETVASLIKNSGCENVVVGGFSQGAIMSLGILSKFPNLAKAGMLLSGRGLATISTQFAGKIFHAHGIFDDVISIRDARSLNEQLSVLGENYEYHEYEMGHWINDDELRDVNRWLAKLIQ